ncbi:3-phenylpropionate MFS transporter [Pasteurella skyensis]|uniref:3-phenylpropionate MFS transporter n=1 Tax=Phocoenobacter skyensis TaxID=97481 RepID=A0AAJ6N952_9PAST|nr:3-phenylpropionate MFS transporter [Pasteurella skyensis]MDP8162533.1 3-phenylpropionate MFS transporter [Pasteurella skyensis]MDP8172498.1 3-phenylpropionate MFS transporter [Pasteurella skyensis]MDP8177523.1 3-phenylpropionate MFS transporter [Pasteurella skyensis]MDP8178753.1 3-phenylpropionate MFS transporter [Pasteurella skyensis]MDP8182957.1 3-phenylpropionate MFS transporter [Pasteurella skyensis]
MIKLSPFQWTSFNFFGYFCAYGVLMPFFPIWLETNGYSSEVIGFLLASGYLFRFLGSLLTPQIVTQPTQLLNVARLLSVITLIVSVMMAYLVNSIWTLVPIFALFHIVNGGSMTIGDAIASTWQKQVGIDYGKTRLFGSIAFVVGSLVAGYVVGLFGEQTIIWLIIGFLFFLTSGQMLGTNCNFVNSEQKHTTSKVTYLALLKNNTVLRMLIAASLIQAAHATYYTYSTLYWKSQGISPQTSSLLWGLSVAAEVGVFFISGKVFSGKKIHHLIIIATLCAITRWVLYAFTTDVILLACGQILHAFTFGLTHFAMIRYISNQPSETIPKLQGLYFGLGFSGITALFTFFSSTVYGYSPSGSFILMAILVAPAILIVPKKY